MAALNHNERSMTLFFDMDALMGRRTARQRERFSHTIFRALEARNECAMQDVGGGSSAPLPVCAPRTQRRTSARKPASRDGDSDGEPAPRYSLAASSHEGFVIETPDGRRATLAVVDCDGNVIAQDVSAEAWKAAVGAYRAFLQGTGHMKVHASAPGLAKA